MIELSITDSAKKKLVKSDILGLRYKQFSGGGVKVLVWWTKKICMYVTGSISQIYTSCNCDCKTSSISPILDKSAEYMSEFSENHCRVFQVA